MKGVQCEQRISALLNGVPWKHEVSTTIEICHVGYKYFLADPIATASDAKPIRFLNGGHR